MQIHGSRGNSVRALFEQAKAAAEAGDLARARALFEQVLQALDPADVVGRSVVLSSLASVLADEGAHERAVELWEEVVVLCGQAGDVRGQSLTLDKIAETNADRGLWARARASWERALAIDTALGNTRDRVATLASLAQAVARTGDPQRASELWSEALAVHEAARDGRAIAAILSAMASTAVALDDWRDPLGLRQRGLCACQEFGELEGTCLALEGLAHECLNAGRPELALCYCERARGLAARLGDGVREAVLLASIASCKEALGETARALELWVGALRHFDALGGDQYRAGVLDAMASARARAGHRPPRLNVRSLSEYEVRAEVAPLFGVGEAFAALHALGRRVCALEPGDVGVGANGLVRLAPSARLPVGVDLDAEAAALDLLAAFERYPRGHACALLAGYVRGAYEMLDGTRPGYTAALLDRLEIPEPRPGPALPSVDVPGILEALGVELAASRTGVELRVVRHKVEPSLWHFAAYDAFQVILAMLVVGADCRPLFERDRPRLEHLPELYRVLFPPGLPARDWERDPARLAALAPGLEMAAGLARVLRNQQLPEPFDFNYVIFWLRKILQEGVEAQAVALGDIVLDVSQRCARVTAGGGSEFAAQMAYVQHGIIALEYVARGRRTDEGRLIACAQSLYGLPGYPRPFEPWGDSVAVQILNSWLITLRELVAKSAAARGRGRSGMLRSAAVKSLPVARHTLLRIFELASSREPDAATHGLALLRVTVKNHATLLATLFRSAKDEQKSGQRSAWLEYFTQGPTGGLLAAEFGWIARFLEAAAQEGFSLDAARPFIHEGRPFLAVENTFSALPPSGALPV